jgi:hypothetical protein
VGKCSSERPGAVDQGGRLLELELADVSFAQFELDSLLGCAFPCLREHPRRRVDPDHTPARRLRNRDRNASGADRELDHRSVGVAGEPDVERDVGAADGRRPVVVAVGPGVVPARHGNTNLCAGG